MIDDRKRGRQRALQEIAQLESFRVTEAAGPSIAEEIRLAKEDRRTWFHVDRSEPPLNTVLAWRNGSDVELAMNCRPDGFAHWAFLR